MSSNQLPAERRMILNLIREACNKYDRWSELPQDRQELIIRRLERGCHNAAVLACIRDGIVRNYTNPHYVGRYSAVCNRVIENLDPTSQVGSHYLLDKLMSGEILPEQVGSLSSYELCPAASQTIRDEIELRKKQKVPNKVTRAYICRKCGHNESIPYEYQGRAVDESSSYSIKCIQCGFVWRK